MIIDVPADCTSLNNANKIALVNTYRLNIKFKPANPYTPSLAMLI